MIQRLSQNSDGTYKIKKGKRIYPQQIKSVVDRSSFRPNVQDARNLLTSDKIGQPVTSYYDFYNGEVGDKDFVGQHQIIHTQDLTEYDIMIEKQTEKVTKMMDKAQKKVKDLLNDETNKATTPAPVSTAQAVETPGQA